MTPASSAGNGQNLEIATHAALADLNASDVLQVNASNLDVASRGNGAATGQIGEFLRSMADYQRALDEANQELARLARLNAGGRAIAEIDPLRIHESRWVATPPEEWTTRDFAALKEDIASTGGNVQAIKVRPAEGRSVLDCFSNDAESPTTFDIVFGHRRHRACMELGLPVLCVVENINDTQLVKEFVAENRSHTKTFSWRLAETLRRAIDDGLFLSLRRLSAGLSQPVTETHILVEMARLPDAVRIRFGNASLSSALATELVAGFRQDPCGIDRNANESDFAACRTTRDVLRRLTETGR